MIDLTNTRFDRLLVVSRADNYNGKVMWNCLCDCGSSTVARSDNLKSGKSRSCGCLQVESVTTHGQAKKGKESPEYISYRAMLNRTGNENDPSYERYGAAGVAVCKRWLGANGFVNFRSDMGRRPKGTTLDRIKNHLGYSPSNCRWATPKEQVRNRRVTLRVTYRGQTRTLQEWAQATGIAYDTLLYRMKSDWPVSRMLSK